MKKKVLRERRAKKNVLLALAEAEATLVIEVPEEVEAKPKKRASKKKEA